MKVLGIDPGYDRLGIAVLSGDASRPTHEHSECFVPGTKDFLERLKLCGERVASIIKEHTPDALAIETLFFAANKTTALGVAQLRGVILYEAARAHGPVFEYGPSQVKLAVTGHGASDKRGVEDMVKRLVTLPDRNMIDDEYDAIAIAITHLSHARTVR